MVSLGTVDPLTWVQIPVPALTLMEIKVDAKMHT